MKYWYVPHFPHFCRVLNTSTISDDFFRGRGRENFIPAPMLNRPALEILNQSCNFYCAIFRFRTQNTAVLRTSFCRRFFSGCDANSDAALILNCRWVIQMLSCRMLGLLLAL
jgi:hypothetical protein